MELWKFSCQSWAEWAKLDSTIKFKVTWKFYLKLGGVGPKLIEMGVATQNNVGEGVEMGSLRSSMNFVIV